MKLNHEYRPRTDDYHQVRPQSRFKPTNDSTIATKRFDINYGVVEANSRDIPRSSATNTPAWFRSRTYDQGHPGTTTAKPRAAKWARTRIRVCTDISVFMADFRAWGSLAQNSWTMHSIDGFLRHDMFPTNWLLYHIVDRIDITFAKRTVLWFRYSPIMAHNIRNRRE